MSDTHNVKEFLLSGDQGWAEIEFENIDLNDARLERRFRRVAEALSGQPEYPINVASRDASAIKAAYRLFDNEKVRASEILCCHQCKTLRRMKDEPVVLAIQDTSFLNFTGHKKTRGLGPIGDSSSTLQGLLLHTSFAVTPRGLPLGVLTHKCWARQGFQPAEPACDDRFFVEKESFKWVEALREVSELPIPSGTQVVHVADRECDMYEFLREANGLQQRYVIRACHDRSLEDSEHASLQRAICAAPVQALLTIEVPTQKRSAELELRFAHITLKGPTRVDRLERLPVSCWVVHVFEANHPEGCEPLSWTLLTNCEVASVDDAVERLTWYRRRWAIEEFHKILKSGCAIEDCRLQTADRLQRYIVLFSVIAWRIFWLSHISRTDPTAPAELVLTKSEIGTLCNLERFESKKFSPQKITVRQAIIAIAALGGHRARRNDPPPGAMALWRGWQRLSSMAELYDSMIKRCGY